MARESGLTIDRAGFEAEMEKQRTRARASWKGAEKAQVNPVYQALPRTEFVGRETLEVAGDRDRGSAMAKSRSIARHSMPKPGGQVGDTGVLVIRRRAKRSRRVESAYSAAPGKTRASSEAGSAAKSRRPGDRARRPAFAPMRPCAIIPARICFTPRCAPCWERMSNRPAAWSSRRGCAFDFTHYTAMDADELAEVERLMNEQILANREVHTDVMDLDHALKTGAMALFGEKYGDKVRVVSIDRVQQGTVRRHARRPHRRYRDLQDRLRRLDFRRRAPHRSHHRRGRAAAVPGRAIGAWLAWPAPCGLPKLNWWSRSKSWWRTKNRSSTKCSS